MSKWSAWLRHPKTTNEKRQCYDDDTAEFVKIRAKRKARRLPDVYDDQFVVESKTWKRAKRKRQWQSEG